MSAIRNWYLNTPGSYEPIEVHVSEYGSDKPLNAIYLGRADGRVCMPSEGFVIPLMDPPAHVVAEARTPASA